jgi:hypothetical protein
MEIDDQDKISTAEDWIAKQGLPGTLTVYRVDIGAYDWAV